MRLSRYILSLFDSFLRIFCVKNHSKFYLLYIAIMLERNLNTKEYEEESRRGKEELYTISKNYDLLGDVSCISKTI